MDTPSWVTDAVFYQIFPDRFASSERVPKQALNLESWDSPPTTNGFKGGDLYGVLEHLDYLEDLGVNALYLNPVFASASNHRYQTYDYLRIDPLLGGDEALRALLDEAHRRQMRVILDGVFNHASRGFWQFHHTLENGAASPYVDWFYFEPERLAGRRNWGAYPTPDEQKAIEHEGSYKAIGYQGWWNMPGLPKFNTGTTAVREFLFGVAEHWIRFGADGWRLDVPNEIDDDSFWQEFRRRVKAISPEAYLVGELWSGAHRWLQGDQFDACMNYQVTAAALSFFPGAHLNLEETLRAGGYQGQVQSIDAAGFADRIDTSLAMYSPDVTRVQLNLLDSHDTPRFLTCAGGDVESLKLALTFFLTFPGAPCMFYGDEIGLEGRHDPDCRRAFPWQPDRWSQDLRDFTQRLISLRRTQKALRWGSFRRLYAGGGTYAFERALDGETLVTVLNAADEAATISIGPALPGPRNVAVAFGAAEVREDQTLQISIGARSSAVLLVKPA
jgi:cyclomaltodextrinase / maltogenic alpha-amylase / neopullulanase